MEWVRGRPSRVAGAPATRPQALAPARTPARMLRPNQSPLRETNVYPSSSPLSGQCLSTWLACRWISNPTDASVGRTKGLRRRRATAWLDHWQPAGQTAANLLFATLALSL